MDEKNMQLRELCGEADGFVQTTHLSRIIEDPVILKMAIDTLDKDNTGRIPFQKEIRVLNNYKVSLMKE